MGIGASTENQQKNNIPPLDTLSVKERLELVKHLRKEYKVKVKSIVNDKKKKKDPNSSTKNDDVLPIVTTADIDDMLYAQIEIEGLITSFEKLRDEGPMTEIDIDIAVTKLFKQYELDPQGNMNATTFKKLMIDVLGTSDGAPSEKEVQKFLNYMDKNNNGMIEKDELVAFIIDGSSASTDERKAFAERSPFHEKLSSLINPNGTNK